MKRGNIYIVLKVDLDEAYVHSQSMVMNIGKHVILLEINHSDSHCLWLHMRMVSKFNSCRDGNQKVTVYHISNNHIMRNRSESDRCVCHILTIEIHYHSWDQNQNQFQRDFSTWPL